MNEKKIINMNGKYHIFFTFTPFNQLATSAVIAGQHFQTGNILIINSAEIPFSFVGAETVNISTERGKTTKKYIAYRAACRIVNRLRADGRIASVNAPHPHHVISNDLMLGKHSYSVNIIEDGIGNYIASQITGKLRSKQVAKRVIAPLFGMKYKTYRGHFTGIDEQIMDLGFFLNPELAYKGDRFRSLRRISISPSTEKNPLPHQEEKALILDQNIESIFSPNESRILRLKLIEYAQLLQAEILWKFHPTQKPVLHQSLKYLNIEILRTKESAEIVALEHNPKYVISFFSSALKNIKNLSPSTRCVALGAIEFDRKRGTSLASLFEAFGVEVT